MQQENTKVKKSKLKTIVISAVASVVIAAIVVGIIVIAPLVQYNNAVSLMEQRKYEDAIAIFEGLQQYKDSADMIKKCKEGIVDRPYQEALELLEQKKYRQARDAFERIRDYKDSEKYLNCFFIIPEKTVYTYDDGTSAVAEYERVFNQDGILIKEVRNTTSTKGKKEQTLRYELDLDANGRATRLASTLLNSSVNVNKEPLVKVYRYDDNGRIIKITSAVGKEPQESPGTLFYYDESGKITKWENERRSITFDANGNIITEKEKYDNNSLSYQSDSEYQYDENGRRIKQTTTLTDKGNTYYIQYVYIYQGDKLVRTNLTETTTVLALDRTTTYNSHWEYDYTYEGDRLVKETCTYYDHNNQKKLKRENTYAYDSEGRIIRETLFDEDNTRKTDITYEYDELGRVIKSFEVYYYNTTDKVNSRTTTNYQYGQDGETANITIQRTVYSTPSNNVDENKPEEYTVQRLNERVYFDKVAFDIAKQTGTYLKFERSLYNN